MKKLILLLVVCVLFIGCGGSSKIPEGMNKETYEYGLKAVSLFEKYADGEITKDELDSRLSPIKEHLDSLSLEDLEDSNNVYVSTCIFTTSAAIDGYGSDFYTQLNDLKEKLNAKD